MPTQIFFLIIKIEAEDRIVKEKLIDTIRNINQKYQSLQQDENNMNELMNVKYKPFLSPLNKIVEHVTNEKKMGKNGKGGDREIYCE